MEEDEVVLDEELDENQEEDIYEPDIPTPTIDLTNELDCTILALEDEEGNESPFQVNFVIEIDGKQYAELVKVGDDSVSMIARVEGDTFTVVSGEELDKVLSSIP